ncbi:DUF4041 domain-containing protein [Laribacter hongkongensis]|uniref:DUF4041 domain-containing protein n=2 Tax=Laribacter hongkongensis TaxID=168471 RepID=UPI001EFCD3D9|nr:DUF4041 domain-containing protein [Laribacter hongkongensis]MCG9076224.1 DUF4041 domain-containing protein [Laribacter hongkongensis]
MARRKKNDGSALAIGLAIVIGAPIAFFIWLHDQIGTGGILGIAGLIASTVGFGLAFKYLMASSAVAAQAEELERKLADEERRAGEIRQNLQSANSRIDELAKYQSIIDVEQEVQQLRSSTREETRAAREKAETMIQKALHDAETIISNARAEAQKIAGDAYEAMNKAAQLEETAKAMKNIIDGYGDSYLIPTHSLLDDLAVEFGHTEAGSKLKTARDHSKLLVKNGVAAQCEYSEANRRDTAIRFVTDAFNGKVESILSRVKHDNVGTLEQEIKDAYHLVNHNGEAFRSARISPAYLASRLDELKWAAVAQELKLREREEQRAIKERIREEERARREYERAIREAAKEEETLKKAMEIARRQLQDASDAKKAEYESKLADLSARLAEAEEKNQRALSMAQQTRAGHVYIISNIGSFGDDVFKIGMTRRLEPLDRVKELGDASVPFSFDVHAMIYSDDAPALENALHRCFNAQRVNKINYRKEFFKLPVAAIREELQRLGLDARFTLLAEAKEYRESLAVDQLPDFQKARLLDDLIEHESHTQDEEEEVSA